MLPTEISLWIIPVVRGWECEEKGERKGRGECVRVLSECSIEGSRVHRGRGSAPALAVEAFAQIVDAATQQLLNHDLSAATPSAGQFKSTTACFANHTLGMLRSLKCSAGRSPAACRLTRMKVALATTERARNAEWPLEIFRSKVHESM
eukprot:172239-Rhodomonas_salina.2